MKWLDMDVLGHVVDSRLHLSPVEAETLLHAASLLNRIRRQLEATYGVDEAAEIQSAEPWVYAESYLSEAMIQLAGLPRDIGGAQIGPFPPRL